MRRVVSRSVGLAISFLLISLVVSGCFQTAGAALDATPVGNNPVQPPPPTLTAVLAPTDVQPAQPTQPPAVSEAPTQGVVQPPTLTQSPAQPTIAVAQAVTQTLPPTVFIPTEIPTDIPQPTQPPVVVVTETPAAVAQKATPAGNAVFAGGPGATQTAIQATLFAQATQILAGVTQTAAVDLTATATALGTFVPAAPAAGVTQNVPATPVPGASAAPTSSTPQGTPGAAGSGAAGPLSGDCVYTVVDGDRMFRIATRFNTTPEALARFNGIVNIDMIVPGQHVRIPNCFGTPTPAFGTGGAMTPTGGAPGAATASANSGKVYVVQEGDTLFGVATRYRVRVMALAQANGISNINLIFIGQRLVIP